MNRRYSTKVHYGLNVDVKGHTKGLVSVKDVDLGEKVEQK